MGTDLDRLVPGGERSSDGRAGNLVERGELVVLAQASDRSDLRLGETGKTDSERERGRQSSKVSLLRSEQGS